FWADGMQSRRYNKQDKSFKNRYSVEVAPEQPPIHDTGTFATQCTKDTKFVNSLPFVAEEIRVMAIRARPHRREH
ncbi:MAG TPA: hypothetical protein PKE12_03660, partial [Kiritimatiellia bacterium]|nr:hypothetical protein [Kiritimatiellia bacterium]